LHAARVHGINSPRYNRMPVAKELRTDPALEAQVFWYKYRKEIAILIVVAIVTILGLAGYRLYRDRREATAATLFSAAKTSPAYDEVINRYGDTAAAASAYLLLADAERKEAKYSEANATLLKFLEKFPEHDLASTARMAMAANLEAMSKQDEALATYQQIASANAGSFNAPMALIEEVHILQEKNRIDDARRICETIMTQYRDSYAAMEASQLLRMFLKSAKAQTPVVLPSKLGSPASATVPPTIKVLPTVPPAPNSPSLPPVKPPPAPSAKP
jgi:predicted negative regulator of RcsB-dependent stress response